MKFVKFLECSLFLGLLSCTSGQKQGENLAEPMPPASRDVHSYANPEGCVTEHLALTLNVDFEHQIIEGTATHAIRNLGSDTFILDIKDLEILSVARDAEKVEPVYSEPDALLGRAMKIPVKATTEHVTIRYRTNPDAAALGWLNPVQTGGKQFPFLYTQGQAILTRTWIPVQDSPGIRFTYEATVHVPGGLMAVMSATNATKRSEDGTYRFEMTRPVPAYLIALAVGDIDFAALGPRTGVYAEPSMLPKAQYELADMERMVRIAEDLYGPYQWDRYDVIILPPSFPFGGMENPRLTFATPTIIAGDRSLVSLIAHELAHSWSGNLVTNATWNDFWLNEGFTSYFENRIMEALYGVDYANMLALLAFQDLQQAVSDLGENNKDTHLFLDLKGRDPDDGMTSIAYDKGAFFLRRLEQAAGREQFDTFLRGYFEAHKFQSMTTAGFVDYLERHLLRPAGLNIAIDRWIYGPGIPPDCPGVISDRFIRIDSVVVDFVSGSGASELDTVGWTTHEWLHFIRHLPSALSYDQMEDLDRAFGLTESGNAEIADAWFELALRNLPGDGSPRYGDQVMPAVESFLCSVGRRKFLRPLYRAMKETGRLDAANAIFEKCRENYHAVSDGTIAALLAG